MNQSHIKQPVKLGYVNKIGKLQVEFDGGHNAWRTLEDMMLEPKKYKGFETEIAACLNSIPLTERIYNYSDSEF